MGVKWSSIWQIPSTEPSGSQAASCAQSTQLLSRVLLCPARKNTLLSFTFCLPKQNLQQMALCCLDLNVEGSLPVSVVAVGMPLGSHHVDIKGFAPQQAASPGNRDWDVQLMCCRKSKAILWQQLAFILCSTSRKEQVNCLVGVLSGQSKYYRHRLHYTIKISLLATTT